jgi:CspA family cold shock protein
MTENEKCMRVTGRVKWFNQFKGYGFVEVEGIAEDVFLHFFAVDKFGGGHLNNNDIILCDVVESDKGYQVESIIEILVTNKYEVESGCRTGVDSEVKWFNPAKGFGFAQLETGEDVFIHSSLLKKHRLTTLESGTKVSLIIHRTNFGYEAVDLVL